MSRHISNRIALLILAPLFVTVIGGGYALYWHRMADSLLGSVESWAEARRAEGWQVSHGPARVSGFPFDIMLDLPGPRILRADGWSWQAEGMTGRIDPFQPTRVQLLAPGAHLVGAPDGGQWRLDAQQVEGGLTLSRQGLDAIELDFTGGTLTAPDSEALSFNLVALGAVLHPPVVAVDHTQPGLIFDLAVDGLDLPGEQPEPLSGRIARFALNGQIMGPPPRAFSAAELAAWRDLGGIVELREIDLAWAPLTVTGAGTLALDGALQPLASSAMKIRGYNLAVDALRDAGMMQNGQANMVKMALTLLAKPGANGEPAIEVPVTIQEQWLYLGPVKLTKLPLIDWN